MDVSKKMLVFIDFIDYCVKCIGIQQKPNIIFTTDNDWAKGVRAFGQYNPSEKNLTVYINNRNLADSLRTLAHELVHHKQNEDGRLDPHSGDTGSDIENEANSTAGVIMRNYGKKHALIYEAEIKDISSKYTIYCDMDGVLCDFAGQFEHYLGKNPEEYIAEHGEKSFHKAVNKAGMEFWSTMPWMPGGEVLWEKIGKYGVSILSSPGEYNGAKEGKLQWIKDHLHPRPKKVIFRPSEKKHMELLGKKEEEIANSVLIDDYSKNLDPWKELGGIAIKRSTGKDAISAIDKL